MTKEEAQSILNDLDAIDGEKYERVAAQRRRWNSPGAPSRRERAIREHIDLLETIRAENNTRELYETVKGQKVA